MKEIEGRLNKLGIQPLNIEQISTRYSGDIFLIHTETQRYIYKHFNSQSDEYNICKEIGTLNGIVPIVHLFEDGILMKDCGVSMKYRGLSQIEVIEIFKTLLEVQKIPVNLPLFPLDMIEWQWITEQIDRLNIPTFVDIKQQLEKYYSQLDIKNYRSSLPHVLAHGDCHLDNIFKTNHIQLIDWERATLSSPIHDATMLIQDIGDLEWFLFYRDTFFKLLAMDYFIEEKQYEKEFNIYFLVNTVKMMVWEIAKYEKGWETEESLYEKMKSKMSLLALAMS